MSRGLWFVAGAGAGVYAMVRGRRAAEAAHRRRVARPRRALALGARIFRDEVAQGRAETEDELRERLAAAGPRADREPAPARPQQQIQHDTQHRPP